MKRMYSNVEIPRSDFRDSSQMTNWILDSIATCKMTPKVSDFVPGSLFETDKYIEVLDGHLLLRYIVYYLLQTCKIDYFHDYVNEIVTHLYF